MRSEPEWWSARVMTARPPAFSTAAATASESVATTASPMRASCARRITWTIMGSPAISASGLPGRRVEAMRAGMSTIAWGMGRLLEPGGLNDRQPAALYGLPEARQTGICPPPPGPRPAIPPRTAYRVPFESLVSMNSFELNKILGAILGTCLAVLALNIAAGAIFSNEKPAKPGYAIAVKKEGGGEKKDAAPKVTPLAVRWPRPRSTRASRPPSSARPATPWPRAAQPGRAQSVGYRRE